MMANWLKYIHQQPKATRERYAFLATIIVTVVIAGGWVFSLSDRFSTLTQGNVIDQTASAPLSGIWEEIKEQFNGSTSPLSRATSSPQNSLEQLVESVERGRIIVPPAPPVATSSPITIMIATTSATTVQNAPDTPLVEE